MKNKLVILLFLPMISFGQLTYVPDDNFEQKLIDLVYDNILDDYVITANIVYIETLTLDNSCVTINDGTGLFSTLEGCQEFCSATSIKEPYSSNKQLRKTINLLGQETAIRKSSDVLHL